MLSDSDAESSISEEDPDPNEAVLSPMRDDITGTGQHIQVWERIVQFGPITEGKGEGAAPAADPNDLDALFESGFDELTSDPITRHESLATLSLPARPVLHDEQNLVHTTTLRQEANEFAICHLMNKVTPDPELDMDQHNEFMATIEPVFARRLIQVQRRAGGMIVGDGKGESGEAVTGAFVAGVDGECAEVYVTWCVVADGELEDD